MRKRIKVDLQLRQQVNQRVYPSFRLQEFIEHHYLALLQYAIAALKRASFIADHIAAFLRYPFYLVKCILSEFHIAFLNPVFKIMISLQLPIFRRIFKITFSTKVQNNY